jgi:D-glycero-alpha-D-manno-heptose 1-phosphate guanylyltransferase
MCSAKLDIAYVTVPTYVGVHDDSDEHDLSEVSAMILAGGMGTRLRSVVADRSKVMADVADRPFVAYLLDQLEAAGLRHVIMCTGFMGDQLRAELGDSHGKIELTYIQEKCPLGTGGAIRNALPLARSNNVLIMNGDSYIDANLRQYWAHYRGSGNKGGLLLTRVADIARYGSVTLDERGRVVSFEEKGAQNGPGLINAGVYLLSKELLMTIQTGRRVSLEQEMLPRWTSGGLTAYEGSGRFLDIGLPETYALAEQFFAKEHSF